MKSIKASILNDNNSLVIVFLGEQFKLEMMVTRRSREATESSEGMPFSSKFSTIEGRSEIINRNCYGIIMDSIVELKEKVIHQLQITFQN